MAKFEVCSQIGSAVVGLLREERQRRGLSMTVLAADAGLSHSMISLMERDLRNPTLETLLRIAMVLEVDLAKVLSKAQAQVKGSTPKSRSSQQNRLFSRKRPG